MAHNTIRGLDTIRDTRSLARFGITSIQVRLSQEEALRWESNFSIAGRRYHLQGFADLGRPRGIDTDVITGLEAIFALRGFPEDNTIITSGYELAQSAHMPDNGRTYERIRESLLRYWRTGFLVREGFEQPGGKGGTTYYNETLGFFEKISFWEQGIRTGDVEQTSLSRDKTLRIVLTPEFAESLRSGYIHQLDRALLRQIEQPPARALYRLLSAHRQQDDGTQADQLAVNLSDWREACGIQDTRPSKVLRSLQAAHDELTAGYLTEVEIAGRGQKTRLTYHFRQQGDPDPALVQLLLDAEFGLSIPVAQQFAAEYPDRVEKAIRFVQARQYAGHPPVRSPAGLLRRVLEDRERYLLDEPELESGAELVPTAVSPLPDAEWEAEQAARNEALLQALPAEQWRACRASLKLVLGNHFSAAEWKHFEQACLDGQWGAAELLQEATRAAARLEMQEFVADLQKALQG
ncbi:replication initiator protein A [Deinococcus sp. Marseille-Q6407]|uniref:replication initiator protein A n=1 Tax=Deinococcus sp. Marseille-Q6407 TaxID=2969223 RepID=UPI0021BF93F7|nr:replication initiator protein A [Deinococcus sp. Marseille-Q6407]